MGNLTGEAERPVKATRRGKQRRVRRANGIPHRALLPDSLVAGDRAQRSCAEQRGTGLHRRLHGGAGIVAFWKLAEYQMMTRGVSAITVR